ncbi:MAG: GntR family transcriptional regulator [Marinilabiliaceae bacterium]|nr:GntR family transcriptional regulator [Marinilabiliaceae bacterium]
MVQIGKYNTLKVVKEVEFGLYLDGGEEHGEILLPIRYVPEETKVDDELEVFIYLDSEDRIIATTEKPFATVGEFAFLQVNAVTQIGAFLDWGLMKDLLVPFREQKMKMQEGKYYPVYIYLDDESQRIVATAKLEPVLDNVIPDYTVGQEVEMFVVERTELGYKVVINNLHSGLIYHNEMFRDVRIGDRCPGFIKKVREDDKIDANLHKQGFEKMDDLSTKVLDLLKTRGGFLAVSDKSPAELIYQVFGMSKKNFKKAIGSLYKQRIITIEKEGIRIV